MAHNIRKSYMPCNRSLAPRNVIRLITSILLALVFIAAGCRTQARSVNAPGGNNAGGTVTTASDWKVELETSGGFSGRGEGSVVVSSDGEAQALMGSRTCKGKLSSEQLERINRLISQARPEGWKESYIRPGNPHGQADQFRYSFRLTLGADGASKTYETFWYDETLEDLPDDLRGLSEAVWAARDPLTSNCAS